jgi:hypothetical protein
MCDTGRLIRILSDLLLFAGAAVKKRFELGLGALVMLLHSSRIAASCSEGILEGSGRKHGRQI